jgi:hypothetical protein
MSYKRSSETKLESTEQPTKKRKIIDNDDSVLFALFLLTHMSGQNESAVDRFHQNPLFDANCVSLVVEFLLSFKLPHLPHLLLFEHQNSFFISAIHTNHKLEVYERVQGFLDGYGDDELYKVDDNTIAHAFENGSWGVRVFHAKALEGKIQVNMVEDRSDAIMGATEPVFDTCALNNFQELVDRFPLPRPNPLAVLDCSCQTFDEVSRFFEDKLHLVKEDD